jgi:hypothetical protein
MINQSVTIINKSGKIVGTSKHLVSVWKEARAAYKSRKAEIKASRRPQEVRPLEARPPSPPQRALEALSLSDGDHQRRDGHATRRSKTTSKRSGARRTTRAAPPGLDRGLTDSALHDAVYAHPADPPEFVRPPGEMARRSTGPGGRPRASSFDEHLAYGDLPPPPAPAGETEQELRGKMSRLNQLLDEAQCLQYSATATIEHLQKNPDALAAVALTLAEISAMVTKVAPTALTSMKLAFPAVIALLTCPEFLIAGGVAVGVTIVMIGGYKIIKHLTSGRQDPDDVAELHELQQSVSHIEVWRRGIADEQASSVGTRADGEFVTPGAERRLLEEGRILPEQLRRPEPRARATAGASRAGRSERGERAPKTQRSSSHHRQAESSYGGSERSARSSRSHGRSQSHDDRKAKGKEVTKKKQAGGLRMLFSSKKPVPV